MSTTATITGNENMPVYLGLAVVVIIVIAYFSKSDEHATKKSKAVAASSSVAAAQTTSTSSKKSKKKNKPKATKQQQQAAAATTPSPVEEKREDKPKKKKKAVKIQEEPTTQRVVQVEEEEPTPSSADEQPPEPETKSTASKKKKKKKKKKGSSVDAPGTNNNSPKTVIVTNNNNTSDDDESEDSDDDELWRIQSASKRKGANDIAKRAAANKERDRVRALKRQEEKAKAEAKAKADAEAEDAAAAAAKKLEEEEEEKAKAIAAAEAAAKEAEGKNKNGASSSNGESATADGSAPAGEKKKRKRKKKKGGANVDEGATRPTLVSGPPPVEHWETVPVEEEWQEVGKKSKPKASSSDSSAPTSSSAGGGGNNNGANANGGSVETPSLSDEPVVVEEQPGEMTSVTLAAGDDPLIFIGKGGATIQHLEESTGCQFHLNRSTNVLTISGTEDAVQLGLAKAQSILTEAEERKANQVEEKVTWGADAIKAVIGRGGVNIRASEEATGARIDADVGAGTLVIVGSADQVKAALTMCHNIAFGEVQEVLELGSRNAVNLVYGPNFTTIRSLQDSTGCRLDITRGSTTLKMAGSAEAVATAKARISALLASNQGFSMTIENSKVGAVYGKGGETLRSIQDRTGTQVDVSRGPTHATVSVMGTAESTARARNMLQRAIDGDVEVKAGEVAEEIELGNATAAVIGRGGSNVAELEKRHGVKINVRSELQKARVVGKPSMVEAAVKDINTIVKPILAAESAQKKADEEVQTGESAWQADDTADDDDAEGW